MKADNHVIFNVVKDFFLVQLFSLLSKLIFSSSHKNVVIAKCYPENGCPAIIYLLKVNIRDTRKRCEIC